jgi:hypothetical protein
MHARHSTVSHRTAANPSQAAPHPVGLLMASAFYRLHTATRPAQSLPLLCPVHSRTGLAGHTPAHPAVHHLIARP